MKSINFNFLLHLVCICFIFSEGSAANYFVKANASASRSGNSWFTAMSFSDFQEKLNNGTFQDGDAIYFSGGIYRLTSGSSIKIKNISLTLKGGFSPDLKASAIPNLSYPTLTPTIITGDANNDGKPGKGDCRNIFVIDNVDNPDIIRNVVIEGFTMTGCFYSGVNTYEAGAICADLSQFVIIKNCIIEGNKCTQGGGAGFSNSGSVAHLIDCVLTNNEAYEGGAAICSQNKLLIINDKQTTYDAKTIVERCLINNNQILTSPNASPLISEVLYNGIQLPLTWPPKNINPNSYDPMPVPYLDNPPNVIPINVGRQLFVDNFLIESQNGLQRKFYKPRKIDQNPVLKAETSLENSTIPGAMPKDGGVWWDEEDKVFKMWYEAGWLNAMAYATSTDGITWLRPNLGLYAQNQIIAGLVPNSCSVIVDYNAPETERYKMFLRPPNASADNYTGYCVTSGDGISWNNLVSTGPCGDRSTMFYNPFRKKYVFSIRSDYALASYPPFGRARYYRECSNLLTGSSWIKNDENVVFWSNADYLDEPDPEIGVSAELYNLNAVAYESIMLGMHQIFVGPQNDVCKELGIPKRTDLKVSFSRDGFHWHRPFRDAFIPSSRMNTWDKGYVQSVGGICSVVGDQLWFYYAGFHGDESRPGTSYGMHSNGAMGIAVLRRDGFCSMSASGEGILTTRPVTFSGKYLFVNVNSTSGSLIVEILDINDNVIQGFSFNDCNPVSTNSTIHRIEWANGKDLSVLSGKTVKFRFKVTNSDFYSFWVSPSLNGESNGYVAGGGPGYTTSTDKEGIKAYEKANLFKSL